MTLFLLLALAASPPDTVLVRPGAADARGDDLLPYEVVWAQYFQDEAGRTLRRTIVDRVERETGPDGSHLVRTQVFLDLDGEPTSRRVNRVDGATLLPLRERWEFGGRVTHVDYDGERVSGAVIDGPAEPASTFDRRLAEPGYDFNVAPLLLAALRLEPELTLRFPHVRISPPAFSTPELAWATFQVAGREEVDAGPLGRVLAWRVVDPEHDMVFWLVPEPPYLGRVAFPVGESTLSVMELGAVREGGGDGGGGGGNDDGDG